MIIDKLENATLYFGINDRIKKALNYIQQTDFKKLDLGKHNIDGDTIYALVYEYTTKHPDNSFLEAHRNYIDIQYIFEGIEQIGLTTLENQRAVKTYNSADDYELFDETYSLISLKKGLFAIFFPDDLHMPGIKMGNPSTVKKVVVKVRI
ncbi:YhcH/YjgK/YiaL family protein [Snuella lapsa]|uniref:YhcH/YjgK/YiaL family protein n=1 Tax=Snuella lapsa TaxID=870481 RepID=A0ABP6YB38_9FLAO